MRYEFHWGVDGSEHTLNGFTESGRYNPDMAKYLRFLNDLEQNDMHVNAIACALSHLQVYRKMLDSGFNKVLVLEDDVILGEKTDSVNLSRALDELPDNWELCYLGHLNNNTQLSNATVWRNKILYTFLHSLGKERYNPELYFNKYPKEYSEGLNLAGYHFGLHAYGMSAEGAKRVLRFQTPVTCEIDIAIAELCRMRFINAFSLKERIFFQNRQVLPSMIEDGRFKR